MSLSPELNELKEPRLLVTMPMMRRHEKDAMLRRDHKYGEDMKKRASDLVAGLAAVDTSPAVKDELKQKLAACQRDFFNRDPFPSIARAAFSAHPLTRSKNLRVARDPENNSSIWRNRHA